MTLIVVLAGWLTAGMAAVVMYTIGALVGRRRGYEEGYAAGRAAGYAAATATRARDVAGDLRVEHVLPDVERRKSSGG